MFSYDSIKRGKGPNNNSNNTEPVNATEPMKRAKTAVYVANSRKCRIIEEDDEGEPKIKMLAREDGSFSGDALVVFSREDSVTLAVNLMDGISSGIGRVGRRGRGEGGRR